MASKKFYTLKEYLDEESGRAKAVCAATGLSPGWLSHMKLGRRDVPPMDAIAIDRATGGAVRCETSCPKFSELFAYLRLTGASERDDPAAVE